MGRVRRTPCPLARRLPVNFGATETRQDQRLLARDEVRPVVENCPFRVARLDLERKEARVRIEQIADALHPLVAGGAGAEEKAALRGLPADERHDGLGAPLVVAELRGGG